MSRSILVVAVVMSLFASTATAQDALGNARNLYESAAYEDALIALGRLGAEASSDAAKEIERYRALCLMALGRESEADKIIESIVMNDPLYQPADAAPRVRAAFTAVRHRVVPGLVRSLYADAKAAFDRKAYPEAVQGLERIVLVVDSLATANQSDLKDFRMLAAGFLELSRAALVPPPPVPAAAAVEAKAEAAPAPEELPPSTPLVALDQTLPPLPFALASSGTREFRGRIELEIDETGRVRDVRILESVNVLYDPLLLKAALEWKYEPPRIAGKPTASSKRVQVVLRP